MALVKLVPKHIKEIQSHADLGLYSVFLQPHQPMTIFEFWSKQTKTHPRGLVCLLCDPEVEPKGRKEYFRGMLSEEHCVALETLVKQLIQSQSPGRERDFQFALEYVFPLDTWSFDRQYFVPSPKSYSSVHMAQPIDKLQSFCDARVPDMKKATYEEAEQEAPAAVRARQAQVAAFTYAQEQAAASAGGAAAAASSAPAPISSLAVIGTRGKTSTVYEPAVVVTGSAQSFFSPAANEDKNDDIYRRFLSYRNLTLTIRKIHIDVIEMNYVIKFSIPQFTVEGTPNPYYQGVAYLDVSVSVEFSRARGITSIYIGGLYNKSLGKRGLAIDALCVILYTILAEKTWEEMGIPAPAYVTLMALGEGPPQPDFGSSSGGAGGGGGGGPGLAPVAGLDEEDRERLDHMIRLVAYYKSLGFKRQKGYGYLNAPFPAGRDEGYMWYLQTNLAPFKNGLSDFRLESTYFSVQTTHAEAEAILEALYP